MSNKQNINEIALSTAENIADELIFKSATTFVEDLAKSVPVASVVLGLTKAISNYKTAKDQRQLLAFIQEAENTDAEFIKKFFQDKTNIELGFEILGILDQTYLEKQARMIFRVTQLFREKVITKAKFNKYCYIIKKLDSHLIYIIENYYESIHDPHSDRKINFVAPNMDLLSFGFLIQKQSKNNTYEYPSFQRTEDFYSFYENIFKD